MEGRKNISEAAARLEVELLQCHKAAMRMFQLGFGADGIDARMGAMKVAARLMQANASAALSLQRLTSNCGQLTVTSRHDGGSPAPQKSKTNGPAGPDVQASNGKTTHGA